MNLKLRDTRSTAAHAVSSSTPYTALLMRLSATRVNGQIGTVADCAVGLALLGAGLHQGRLSLPAALASIVCGLLLFSLAEYVVHRWLFHAIDGALERGHRKHHEAPMGYDALPFFLPPLGMLALAGLLDLVMPATAALLFAGAFALGYATYGLSHYTIHNHRFRHVLPRRWAAAHHIHHFHPDTNFGVTSLLWDFVFGTRYISDQRTGTR